VGVDISAPLLNLARERAAAEGLGGAEFIQADAQTWDAESGAFDAVISRFGVMFFSAPEAAFANLRRATRAGGRLAFAAWRSPADNPLAELPLEAARPFLSRVPAPPPADAPGRWAFADPDRVRAILDAAGWRDVEITPLDTPSPVSFDEAMGMSLNLGSLGPLLRQESHAVRARVQEAVAKRLSAQAVGDVVPMTSACWLVSAST
jgi:SAM-dependent methyltransferase